MAVAVQSGHTAISKQALPRRCSNFVPLVWCRRATVSYSPSADGQRFLVQVQPTGAEPTVNVISNWEKAALGSK